jgi:hypothetical protein
MHGVGIGKRETKTAETSSDLQGHEQNPRAQRYMVWMDE